MEGHYIYFLLQNKVYFSESGICGESKSFFSSIFSITDCVSCKSPLEITTSKILEMINKAAIIPVDLLKNFQQLWLMQNYLVIHPIQGATF
jgi:hypothetical protein